VVQHRQCNSSKGLAGSRRTINDQEDILIFHAALDCHCQAFVIPQFVKLFGSVSIIFKNTWKAIEEIIDLWERSFLVDNTSTYKEI
jgi:hypothetical protein